MFKELFNLEQRFVFAIHDSEGAELFPMLWLIFSYLNGYKFGRTVFYRK